MDTGDCGQIIPSCRGGSELTCIKQKFCTLILQSFLAATMPSYNRGIPSVPSNPSKPHKEHVMDVSSLVGNSARANIKRRMSF